MSTLSKLSETQRLSHSCVLPFYVHCTRAWINDSSVRPSHFLYTKEIVRREGLFNEMLLEKHARDCDVLKIIASWLCGFRNT